MEYIFKDVLDVKNGKNQREVECPDGQYPIYGSGGVMGYASDYICEADTVIIGRKGSINNPIYAEEPFWNVDTAFGLCAKKDILLPKYLFYFCIKFDFERLNRTVTIPSLTKSDLLKIKIQVPSLDVQQEVIDKLTKIESILNFRKQELKLLDELVRGRFVELFGDIKTNEYGWEKCTFKDVSTKITDGEHGTVPRVDKGEGYLYFMARNITKEGEIDLSETSFVPREIHEKIYKRCNPEKDDLLLVCVGATIGKCTLVSEIMGEFSMARSVALIKPNKEMVTSNFLINLLRSEAIQNDIDHCSHAAAQAGLYTNMINSLEAFVPPMDLQIEFDMFCEQVNKSKFRGLSMLTTMKSAYDQQTFIYP